MVSVPTRDQAFAGLSSPVSYLNCLLHSLFLTPEFRSKLAQWEYNSINHGEQADCLILQLQFLFDTLESSQRQFERTDALVRSFHWTNRELLVQTDFRRFTQDFFDALEAGLSQDSNFVQDLFGGIIRNTACSTCKEKPDQSVSFYGWKLDIQAQPTSIFRDITLQNLHKEQRRELFCPQCEKVEWVAKALSFEQIPQIFVLFLKEVNLTLFESLELPEEYENSTHGSAYELYALCIPSVSAETDNYIVYIRNSLLQWYLFNNADVKQVSYASVKRSLAERGTSELASGQWYMLMYRQTCRQPSGLRIPITVTYQGKQLTLLESPSFSLLHLLRRLASEFNITGSLRDYCLSSATGEQVPDTISWSHSVQALASNDVVHLTLYHKSKKHMQGQDTHAFYVNIYFWETETVVTRFEDITQNPRRVEADPTWSVRKFFEVVANECNKPKSTLEVRIENSTQNALTQVVPSPFRQVQQTGIQSGASVYVEVCYAGDQSQWEALYMQDKLKHSIIVSDSKSGQKHQVTLSASSTLRELKDQVASRFSLCIDEFTMKRSPQAICELNDLQRTLHSANLVNNSSVWIDRPVNTRLARVDVFLLGLAGVGDLHWYNCTPLGTLFENHLITQDDLKAAIVQLVKRSWSKITANTLRVWTKTGLRLGEVVRNGKEVIELSQFYGPAEFAVQILSVSEQDPKPSDAVVLVRKYDSRTQTLSGLQFSIVSKHSSTHEFGLILSQQFRIPQFLLEFCKPTNLHLLHVIDLSQEHFFITEDIHIPLENHPCQPATDGSCLIIREKSSAYF